MKLKQATVYPMLGGFQVQLTSTMSYYMVYINLTMMAAMFWVTTASPTLLPYLPWLKFYHFGGFMLAVVAAIMILDYIFIYPSRQGFMSGQAYKHANPVVRDLNQIKADIQKIKEALNIDS